MAVTMDDIKKLRAMTGAGMMDVKKTLEETDGDVERKLPHSCVNAASPKLRRNPIAPLARALSALMFTTTA